MHTVRKLSFHEMVERAESILHPDGTHTSAEIDNHLLDFCINCPDPGAAMDLILEAPRGVNVSDMVEQALSFPLKPVLQLPEAELALDHPLRNADSTGGCNGLVKLLCGCFVV